MLFLTEMTEQQRICHSALKTNKQQNSTSMSILGLILLDQAGGL